MLGGDLLPTCLRKGLAYTHETEQVSFKPISGCINRPITKTALNQYAYQPASEMVHMREHCTTATGTKLHNMTFIRIIAEVLMVDRQSFIFINVCRHLHVQVFPHTD